MNLENISAESLTYKEHYCKIEFSSSIVLRCEIPKMSAKSFRNYLAHHDDYKNMKIFQIKYYHRTKERFLKSVDSWTLS